MSFVNFKVIIVLRLIKCAAIHDSMIRNNKTMTKSELIAMMASKQPHLHLKDVDLAVNSIIAVLTTTLANGERIEIRGFGGFSTTSRAARIARNPKTGEAVSIPNRHLLHFKPGLDLRQKVNASRVTFKVIKDA